MRKLLHSVRDVKVYNNEERTVIEMWRAGRFVTSWKLNEYEHIWKKMFKEHENKSQKSLDFPF